MTTTNLILAVLLAIISLLPGCGTLNGQTAEERVNRATDRLEQTANRVDRNGDGVIDRGEAKGASSDILVWSGVIGTILAALGFGKAQQATKAAELSQRHVDELHDKVTGPVVTAPPK